MSRWAELENSPEYKALSPDKQAAAKRGYWLRLAESPECSALPDEKKAAAYRGFWGKDRPDSHQRVEQSAGKAGAQVAVLDSKYFPRTERRTPENAGISADMSVPEQPSLGWAAGTDPIAGLRMQSPTWEVRQMADPSALLAEPERRSLLGEAGYAIGRGIINVGENLGAAGQLVEQRLPGAPEPRIPTADAAIPAFGPSRGPAPGAGLGQKITSPDWWVNVFGEQAPILGGGIASYGLGGPVGGFAFMAAQEGGSQYRQALQEGAPEPVAALEGVGVGAVNGMLEMIPVARLFNKSGAGQAVKRGALRAVARLARAAAEQGAVEGLTEGMQEIVSVAAEKLGHSPDKRLLEEWRRIAESAVAGAGLGVVSGGAGAVIQQAAQSGGPAPDATAPTTKPVAPVQPKPVESPDVLVKALERVKAQQGERAVASKKELARFNKAAQKVAAKIKAKEAQHAEGIREDAGQLQAQGDVRLDPSGLKPGMTIRVDLKALAADKGKHPLGITEESARALYGKPKTPAPAKGLSRAKAGQRGEVYIPGAETIRALGKRASDAAKAFKLAGAKVLQVTGAEPSKIVEIKENLGREVYGTVMRGVHKGDVARLEFEQRMLETADKTIRTLAKELDKYPADVLEDLMTTREHGLEGKARALQRGAFARLPAELKDPSLRRAIDEIAEFNYKALQEIAGEDINEVQDYFYGIYKNPDAVDRFLKYWKTTDRYTKEKTFPTYADARAAGLKIRNPNPVHNLMAEYVAIAKRGAMQDMRDKLMESGEGRYIWERNAAPQIAREVHDPTFKDVLLDPDLARLVNNMISANLVSQAAPLRTFRGVNNALRITKFAGSAFHLLNIAKQSLADSGYFMLTGGKTLGRGLTRGFTENDPIFSEPWYKEYVATGGGHKYSLESRAVGVVRDWINRANKYAALRVAMTPIKIPVAFADWMFEKYIPKVKATKWLDAVAAREKSLGRQLTTGEKADVHKTIQNFYGEMNERLFGRSGTMTSLLRFIFIAPSYAEGNFRTIFKAMTDWSKAGGGGQSRRNIANSLMLSALIAAVTTYLLTGKPPKKPKTPDDLRDLFKADTGHKDEKGREIYIDFLTYDKDYWDVLYQTARGKPHKAAAGAIRRVGGMRAPTLDMAYDMASVAMGKGIRDWRDERVAYKHDPALEKLNRYFFYELEKLAPISSSVYRRNRQRNLSHALAAVQAFTGVRPTFSEAEKRRQQALSMMYSARGEREKIGVILGRSRDARKLVREYNSNVKAIIENAPEDMTKEWADKLLIDEQDVVSWRRFPIDQMTDHDLAYAIRKHTTRRGVPHKDWRDKVIEWHNELSKRSKAKKGQKK